MLVAFFFFFFFVFTGLFGRVEELFSRFRERVQLQITLLFFPPTTNLLRIQAADFMYNIWRNMSEHVRRVTHTNENPL